MLVSPQGKAHHGQGGGLQRGDGDGLHPLVVLVCAGQDLHEVHLLFGLFPQANLSGQTPGGAPRHPRAEEGALAPPLGPARRPPRRARTPTVLSSTLQSCSPSFCGLKVQVRFSWFSSQPGRAGGLRGGAPSSRRPSPRGTRPRRPLTPERGCRGLGGAAAAAAVHGAAGAARALRKGRVRRGRTRGPEPGGGLAGSPRPPRTRGSARRCPSAALGPAALTVLAALPAALSPAPAAAARSCYEARGGRGWCPGGPGARALLPRPPPPSCRPRRRSTCGAC